MDGCRSFLHDGPSLQDWPWVVAVPDGTIRCWRPAQESNSCRRRRAFVFERYLDLLRTAPHAVGVRSRVQLVLLEAPSWKFLHMLWSRTYGPWITTCSLYFDPVSGGTRHRGSSTASIAKVVEAPNAPHVEKDVRSPAYRSPSGQLVGAGPCYGLGLSPEGRGSRVGTSGRDEGVLVYSDRFDGVLDVLRRDRAVPNLTAALSRMRPRPWRRRGHPQTTRPVGIASARQHHGLRVRRTSSATRTLQPDEVPGEAE